MEWYEVSSAVTGIGQLLVQKGRYLWSVEDQVKRLQTELNYMQCLIKNADAKKAEDETIRLWISEVRELACHVEYVIDTFALAIAHRRKGGVANFAKKYACFIRDGWRLYKVRSEIEDIMTNKISDLTRRLQTYAKGLSNVGEGSSSFAEKRDSRRPYPHIIEDNIVGLGNEIEKLVSVLVGNAETSKCRVVSICGMGGLGKTTLAKKVYHHGDVRRHFDHLAWIFVSQQFHERKLWEDILSSFGFEKKSIKEMGDEEIPRKLSDYLKEKKCLVILDDIWTTEAWDKLNAAFPMSETVETDSKILLTSRYKEIVSHADRRGHLHELQCLTDEQSWELLQKIAFPDDMRNPADARLEELGQTMVKSCAGLPLAIIVLGGVLSQRNSLYDWQKVSEHVKSYLNRDKVNGVEHVLALSYDDLPPYLKPCFLYLSLFPEDYEIDADLLIQLWIAEGIISEKDEKSGGEIIEDVAERYVVELAQRCMIQVGERDATFKIVTCRMHDLMRDLCLSKAKEENFLCIIDHTSQFNTTPITRRIVAHKPTPPQCIKGSRYRSIFFFDSLFDLDNIKEVFLNVKMLKHFDEHAGNLDLLTFILAVFLLCRAQGSLRHLFNNFKLLRVLHFGGRDKIGGFKLPSAVGNLIHLRFLSLRDFEFVWPKIPSSLGNLRCLQTLDLRVEGDDGIFDLRVYVPDVIWKLEQLRHLYLPEECKRKRKLKLHTLRNLQTLVNFNTEYCFAADLSKLINLTKLEIRGSFDIGDLDEKSPIIKSKRIRYLSIKGWKSIGTRNAALLLSSCLTLAELRLWAEIGKLPEYHHFPSSTIAYIRLIGCSLAEDPMPILEKLPYLRILEIESGAFMGNKMVCSAQGFPKLDSLCFRGLEKLEEWNVDGGAMPTLRHLEIDRCKNLKMLPEGLSSIKTLRELKIIRMPKQFKDKVMEGVEAFRKVQHFPSIIFQDCDDLSDNSVDAQQ